MGEKDGSFLCNGFLEDIIKIGPHKSITDVVMFDVASNVQLSGELLKIHYPKVSVMHGIEHTVSLFFNDVSKIPVVNQMIITHKAIYNFLFLEYIKNLIIYSNQNHMIFAIGILIYSVAMIPGWMVISLECTEICA